MATGPQAFYCLWQEERIREILFEQLSKEDICSVRLANSACCNLVTKRLFLRTHLNFTANTFTKVSRIQALSRIGHHIQHLTFSFAHSEATFLPPLVHPETGQEISFLYTPYTHMASSLTRPKYANSELGDILTQQYPPLFHAATNVPSFINAFKHLPNMRHLTIRCPGQDASERYRRDIVDYALISLRISLERAPLRKLNKLTLASVHPAAFNYLRHVPGFGCTPSAGRRWRQIRKLYIQVDSWDFYGPSPGLDHLKIIDDYIRHLAPTLEKISFTWIGRKGPCPLALHADPLFAPPRGSRKLFNEVTSPMSPLPPAPARQPMVLPRLRRMTVRNATMGVAQVSALVRTHQATVREFDFENVELLRGGSWDDALSPLMDQSSDRGSDVWSRHSIGGVITGDKLGSDEAQSFRTAPSPPPSRDGEVELPSPSAAAAAASRELLDLDVEGLENFLGLNGEPELPARRLSSGRPPFAAPAPTTVAEEDEGYQDASQEGQTDLDEDVASDIAAAREASMSLSTKLQKKQLRRRRKNGATREDDDTEAEEQRRRRRHNRHRDEADKTGRRAGHRERAADHEHACNRSRDDRQRSSSRHRHRSRSSHSRRRHHPRRHRHERRPGEEARRPQTPPPTMPEVVLAEGDDVFAPTPGGARRSGSPPPLLRSRSLNISGPMLSREPMPPLLLLKPTVYDPSQRQNQQQHKASVSASVDTTPTRPPGRRRGSDGSLDNSINDDGLSPVQRNIEQEEAHRLLAEDAAARTSALQKAKAAVMSRLARKLGSGGGGDPYPGGAGLGPGIGSGPFGGAPSIAALCAADAARSNIGYNNVAGAGAHAGVPSSIMGFRLREGLFGTKSSVSVVQSHQSIDSNSALVPLIFSR